ncbi:YoaK family protein [Bosea rubneri]|uniref:YoaK family protein n=1 Tax=Bosea rubneri TaxID=3075434 RepID=UPI0036F360F0
MLPRFRIFHWVAAHKRTLATDEFLGNTLAFIAGAINAGGFLAVGQYTSHVTGFVSSIADNLVLGSLGIVLVGVTALVTFVSGSACSAVLINWGRRNAPGRQYAYPLGLEAALLLLFGALGSASGAFPGLLLLAAPLLCFIMGLQNATITKISGARMRTTHLTGMVTDIGIEMGKLFYWNRRHGPPGARTVAADRRKLAILLRVVGMFFAGGIVGAVGFAQLGYVFTVPLAAILLGFVWPTFVRIGKRP